MKIMPAPQRRTVSTYSGHRKFLGTMYHKCVGNAVDRTTVFRLPRLVRIFPHSQIAKLSGNNCGCEGESAQNPGVSSL